MTVDWYIDHALPDPPTFDDAQLTGVVSSANFRPSSEYYLYVYVLNMQYQWEFVETIALGRPTNHSLVVASPFENGFVSTIDVLFEVAH